MDEDSSIEKDLGSELSVKLDKILTPDDERRVKALCDKYPGILYHVIITLITKLEDAGILPEGNLYDVIMEGVERWKKNG